VSADGYDEMPPSDEDLGLFRLATTPTTDGVPHEGTMWRVVVQVDRRHYQCRANTGDPNTPRSWPEIVEHIFGGTRCWRCEGCAQVWTDDNHWAEPDYQYRPDAAATS
jgi:hypothetical protein